MKNIKFGAITMEPEPEPEPKTYRTKDISHYGSGSTEMMRLLRLRFAGYN
jgi:hypothetical protein